MEEDLKQLQRDTDLRNAQITDLQQKILDSDQGKTSASLITRGLSGKYLSIFNISRTNRMALM